MHAIRCGLGRTTTLVILVGALVVPIVAPAIARAQTRQSSSESIVATGVDDQGRLLLDTPSGRVAVLSGDVSLRLAQ